ncbi:hypothetical protein VOI54_03835 [Tamlana sp. 2201CG12-4]|uniref:hypothetical protein n=1 Tax=Tamlana sp. 2201CG12-4 TaxID=3112582 RepID=UPI002DB6F48B|nr:hypothetical protein [Tamlana sp. 2201CG12-4]MEC3906134.1 hypothetical protein [Tamlana sp. 2201CG12-4]
MKNLTLLVTLCIFFIGCHKDDDSNTPPVTIEPPVVITDEEFAQNNFGEEITASFIGQVIDKNGVNIENASISLKGKTTVTDENGVFIINDISVNKNFVHIKVVATGYIQGSKSLIPIQDSPNNVKITLLKKENTASVNSGSSSEVTLSNGAKVEFTGDFINADGSSYNGQVNVMLDYLPPNMDTTFSTMPGMLFGRRENGTPTGMETYGMLFVNLYSPSGEKLNINPSSPAILTFPVDTSTPDAPQSIPIWYFDHEVGYWKEEGNANKIDNTYIAEVTHFTPWNIDIPFESIKACFTIESESPLASVVIKITDSDGIIYYEGSTNGLGEECGLLPKNRSLSIQVYKSKDACFTEPLYVQNIGPYLSDISVTITIPNLPDIVTQSTLNLIANNCNNNPITNGFVALYKNDALHDFIYLDNGIIDYTFINCDSNNFSYVIVDYDTKTQSDEIIFNLSPGDVYLGTVNTCNQTSGGTYIGDIQLTTQQEVEDFGALGYDAISGKLTIGKQLTTVEITDLTSLSDLKKTEGLVILNTQLSKLDGLNNITSINNELSFSRNPNLTSLDGLNNITSTNFLYINKNENLVSLTGLNNLKTINTSLSITNSHLTSLNGLNGLITANIISLRDNTSLNTLEGLNNLTTITGRLKIEGDNGFSSLEGLGNLISTKEISITNSNLPSMKGLSNNLTTVENFHLYGNDNLINLEGLEYITSITNNLSISNHKNLTSLTGLNSLTSLNGCQILSNSKLASLEGLSNTQSIDWLQIELNSGLLSLEGLGNIEFIDDILIQNNDSLTSLYGFQSLTSVGNLEINLNDKLTSLEGLNNIKSARNLEIRNSLITSFEGLNSLINVEADFYIYGNSALNSLNGLNNLESVGDLIITQNHLLESLQGLNSLKSIIGDLSVFQNNNLISANGLNNLESVGKRLSFTGNPSLTSLEGLNNLKTVDYLSLFDDDLLTSLNGLDNLISINSRMEIRNNLNLASLNGMNNITSIGDILTIKTNPLLSNFCALKEVTNLSTIKTVTINDNQYNPTTSEISTGNCSQ